MTISFSCFTWVTEHLPGKYIPLKIKKNVYAISEKIHKAQNDQFLKVKRRQRQIYKEQIKLGERLDKLEKSVGGVAKDPKV